MQNRCERGTTLAVDHMRKSDAPPVFKFVLDEPLIEGCRS